jgi:tRNA/rRNA methyltransferase
VLATLKIPIKGVCGRGLADKKSTAKCDELLTQLSTDNRNFTCHPMLHSPNPVAHSDTSAPADATRFIMIGTSHPGNVGAAARAMKVMGFSDLVLVAPRFDDVQHHPQAHAMASGATDVLERARVVTHFIDALDGITYVCATAMTPRDFGPPTRAPRDLFAELASTEHRVAIVLGCERYGMSNEDVYRCHVCLSIPTWPAYGSLNLAQAVQLLAYDWRQAQGGFSAAPGIVVKTQHADGVALQGLLDHWQQTLTTIGYLDPAVPRKLMPRLRQLLNRAQLTKDEVNILRGVARVVTNLANQRPEQPAE